MELTIHVRFFLELMVPLLEVFSQRLVMAQRDLSEIEVLQRVRRETSFYLAENLPRLDHSGHSDRCTPRRGSVP